MQFELARECYSYSIGILIQIYISSITNLEIQQEVGNMAILHLVKYPLSKQHSLLRPRCDECYHDSTEVTLLHDLTHKPVRLYYIFITTTICYHGDVLFSV